MTETDVVVIGAGPGGSASAIALRKRGFNVTVLEKNHFPKDKVCGEFIAPLGVRELKRLGIVNEIRNAGASEVRRILLYSGKGAKMEIPFERDEFGLGMSRQRLDALLFERSRGEGTRGIEGFMVEDIRREKDNTYRVEGTHREGGIKESFLSKAVINASGLRGIGVGDQRKKSPLYAFKVHLENMDCGDAAELFFYEGGYGGVVNIEEGLVSLAFQVQKRQVALMDRHPLDIIRKMLPPRHPVQERLLKAKPVGKWVAIGTTCTEPRKPLPEVWNIGDASGLIHPFTGLGMSLALQGGRILGETLDIDKYSPVYDLKTSLNKKRFIAAAVLKTVLFHPGTCHIAIKYGSLLPWLGKTALKQLHS
jgi:flavin-dependent dehydrogenase